MSRHRSTRSRTRPTRGATTRRGRALLRERAEERQERRRLAREEAADRRARLDRDVPERLAFARAVHAGGRTARHRPRRPTLASDLSVIRDHLRRGLPVESLAENRTVSYDGSFIPRSFIHQYRAAYEAVVVPQLHGGHLPPAEHRTIAERLLVIARVAPALFEADGVRFLAVVFREWGSRGRALAEGESRGWVRSLDTWQPSSRTAHRLGIGLVRHVLLREAIPARLLRALVDGVDPWATIALRLGRGIPLRRALEGFPAALPPVTRRLVHLFGRDLEGPGREGLTVAVRRAQLRALGANDDLAGEVARAFERRAPIDEERFEAAFAWMVRASARSDRHPLGRHFLHDWIAFVTDRFERDPRWSLRRREPREVLAQIERWKREQAFERTLKIHTVVYPEPELRAWRTVEVDPTGAEVRWWFRPIRLGRELVEEGLRMRHCIASYHWEAERGVCSIWSLTRDGKACLTIEVRGGFVAEVRGHANRNADHDERSIVGQWASRNGLRVSGEAHVW